MNWLKSHLTFDRGQRDGILVLIILNLVLICVILFVDINPEAKLELNSPELLRIKAEVDSLKLLQKTSTKTANYPFNPNFISEYKAYTLGLTVEEYENLKAFRENNQWINSISDFQRVTGVSDSLLEMISMNFKFPDWITNPRPKTKSGNYTQATELPYSEKTDLNIATSVELQEISGVGNVLSGRIISYREKLGGFASDEQLYAVYGLKEEVIERIKQRFTVKAKSTLVTMNINEVSASDIATIPGIDFELAKEIWEFVRLREGIDDLAQLEKIEGLTPHKLRLIRLYLSTD
ncbi:MAG: helix-hairpin-helix domain-containing protein [Bacteroidia bacterium]|nr:helix-hairpin-helix domain-containing protein [Bacteroidia bacterium]NNF32258.1 helix-hairpin-helix domain-containing protein [Flavobacteriaceae bacterium]MBT8276900.1 helix-hairpin-helix domain-containing protein [Bacteroidia bacterium]NNJ82908.1 helix-hairpin-helix domain-containing protein [Flavobacteriaceae bacterium]NNK53783.1 helix-hairpin-helix domain-containing protein [Flavobacteriaceae bacterium]